MNADPQSCLQLLVIRMMASVAVSTGILLAVVVCAPFLLLRAVLVRLESFVVSIHDVAAHQNALEGINYQLHKRLILSVLRIRDVFSPEPGS
jgi:hypothetical protein